MKSNCLQIFILISLIVSLSLQSDCTCLNQHDDLNSFHLKMHAEGINTPGDCRCQYQSPEFGFTAFIYDGRCHVVVDKTGVYMNGQGQECWGDVRITPNQQSKAESHDE